MPTTFALDAGCVYYIATYIACIESFQPLFLRNMSYFSLFRICHLQETSHYRERRRQRMRPRQPTPRVRVFSHTRNGAGGVDTLQTQRLLCSAAAGMCGSDDAHALCRLPRPHPPPPARPLSHGVVLCPASSDVGRATHSAHCQHP